MNQPVVASRTKLEAWMNDSGYTNRTLADEMAVSYELIFKLSTGSKAATDGFRWKFAQRFGWDLANRLFESPEVEYA